MTRPFAAIAIVVGGILLALVVGLVSSVKVFGYAVFGMFLLMAAPLCLAFGMWLKGHGFQDYAKYAIRASLIMFLGVVFQYKLPDLAPGTVTYVQSWFSRLEQRNRRAALEALAPKPVPCGSVLVGPGGEPLYWFHPTDDPLVCYDKAGEQPQGRGALLPVNQAVAQIIERQRLRPVAALEPTAPVVAPTPPVTEELVREVLRTELAKAQPALAPVPKATPQPQHGVWLSVPDSAKP